MLNGSNTRTDVQSFKHDRVLSRAGPRVSHEHLYDGQDEDICPVPWIRLAEELDWMQCTIGRCVPCVAGLTRLLLRLGIYKRDMKASDILQMARPFKEC